MDNPANLSTWLVIWMAAFAAIFIWQWKTKAEGVGLIVGYTLNLWLLHWLASACYILPWYDNAYLLTDVFAGFRQSTYAILSFGVGCIIVSPLLMRVLRFPPQGTEVRRPDSRLIKAYLGVGIICYFILFPFLGGLPSITAAISSGYNLVVVGLVLKCWDAWRRGKRKAFVRWALMAVCMPFITVVTQGFIGYGAVAALAVFAFITSFYRPRWKLVIFALIIGYFGLSLYVTYMRDRQDIRDVVWGGQSYEARIERMYTTFSQPELFDPVDSAHLRRIDERLNQSALVGASIRYMETGQQDFAEGDTLLQALIAPVPRVLWWDKPVTAGSGHLVTTYTGIQFAQGTSVGIGQVMELYINFGTVGVVMGFMVLGTLIALFDKAAAVRLAEGDWQSFTFWFLPGLGFMQVGGQLVEVTMSVCAALVLAGLIKRYVLPRMRSQDLTDVVTRQPPVLASARR